MNSAGSPATAANGVRAGVALNPGTPSALLIGLVQDASDWVAGLAASHPRADRGVWEAALARGGRVLMDLVAIPWLDPDLAASAAATGEADVRETLARRTANRDLLVQLARGCRPQGEGRRGREPVRWTAVELTGQ